jgi:hypothetical protein
MTLKEVAILILAGEAYAGTLLFSYRHELTGAVFHGTKHCACPSWRRCTAVKRGTSLRDRFRRR